MRLVVALEEAEGQDDIELAGERLEFGDALVALDRLGQFEMGRQLVLAKIGSLEKLLDENDVRALGGGLADQFFRALKACGAVLAAGHLGGGECDVSHRAGDSSAGTPTLQSM